MLKKLSLAAILSVAIPAAAWAQSVPNGTITQGQVWTPAQWNAAWQAKVDTTGGVSNNEMLNNPVLNNPTIDGFTFTGPLTATSGGTLSGTFGAAGATFTSPTISGGTLSGTFAGSPTFSGSPSTQSVTFTGNTTAGRPTCSAGSYPVGYNTTLGSFEWCNGTTWLQPLSTSGGTAGVTVTVAPTSPTYTYQFNNTYNASGGSSTVSSIRLQTTVENTPGFFGYPLQSDLILQAGGSSQWVASVGEVTKKTPTGGFTSAGGPGGWSIWAPYANQTNLPSSISGTDVLAENDLQENNLDTIGGRYGYQFNASSYNSSGYTPEVAYLLYAQCNGVWCDDMADMGGNYVDAAIDLRFSAATEPAITSDTPSDSVYSVTVDNVMPLAHGGLPIKSTAAITGITATAAASGTSLSVSAISGLAAGQSGSTDYLANGMYVIDVTNPTDIPANTTISSGAGTTSLTLSASTTVAKDDVLVFSRGQQDVTINGDSYTVQAITLATQDSTAGTVYFTGAVTVADATNGNLIVPSEHTIWLWEGTSGPPVQPPDDIAFDRAGDLTLAYNFVTGGGKGIHLAGGGLTLDNLKSLFWNNASGAPTQAIFADAGNNLNLRALASGTSVNLENNAGFPIAQFSDQSDNSTTPNYFYVYNQASGSSPQLGVTGSDTNINMILIPKGSGMLRPEGGSWTANGSVATSLTSLGPTGSHTTVQEWFTVVDSNGNTRYIPAF